MRKRKTGRRSKPPARPRPVAKPVPALAAEWPIPVSAALGSSVRLTGIEREIRARLPWQARTCVTVENNRVLLGMAEGEGAGFKHAATVVAGVMQGIETLPVLPGEVEDILTITAYERQKWLKDGRLKSVGTRTVKLRGRAKAVTFHVFDPREVEDALDRDLPALWREEDVRASAENRRRAAAKAASARANGTGGKAVRPGAKSAKDDARPPRLDGWDAFAGEGFLR